MKKRLLIRCLRYASGASLGAAFLALLLGWVLIPGLDVKDFAVSPTLLDRQGRLYHARLSADEEWLLPRPLPEMGRWLPKVAVAIEDKRFYRHPGIDLLALLRAVHQNISHGRVVSGASTISVQVVRLAQRQDRTIFNKYVEFIQALKLERIVSKEELLEIYLNRAPFGGNLRGAESAARFYFDKSARDLSLGESALLVALLRGPSLYRPDHHPELARQRRDMILDQLVAKGVATPQEAADARAEPVDARRGSMPRRAWHFSEIVFSHDLAAWQWGEPDHEYGLKSSLDLDMQDALEMRLRLGLAEFPPRVTGAGAIMDNASGGILAYVGNSRWTGAGQGHWVDCALARRSPGSALKPFVYLAAFLHKGLTPISLVADTPLRLSGQAPRNFDKYYRGPVSAQVALADSLNAPAVRMLRLVGHTKSLEILRAAGFTYLNPGRDYGDSLILGSCEVDLWQMLGAYALLARQGLDVVPSVWDTERPILESKRVFPAGAVWLVNEALRDNSRLPAGPRLNQEHNSRVEPAFKTGTSHGLRDVWLAAYTPAHTTVLWAGDPGGQGHPDLTAIDVLGPILVPLAGALPASSPWPVPPEDVEEFTACPISGEVVGPHCPGRYQSFRLKSGARTHPCRIHQLQGGRVVSLWPPELAGFMAASTGFSRQGDGPAITSPLPGGSIVLEEDEGRMLLKCEGARGVVHWYIDDEFYVSVPAGLTALFSVTPGQHQVSLLDSSGRTATAQFTVMYAQGRDRDRDLPLLSFD